MSVSIAVSYPQLGSYLACVRAWHGEIRPLRLVGAGQSFRAPPQVIPLSELFVLPALSPIEINPGPEEPDLRTCDNVLQLLEKNKRLVVLGDPGAGKSTLVSWLAARLAEGNSQGLPDWFSPLIPLPMVLREIKFPGDVTVSSLFDGFFNQLVAEPLRPHRALVESLVASGQALLLIDGLDELAAGVRAKLTTALRLAFRQFSESYWLITSRIVGYEEAPLEEGGTLFSPRFFGGPPLHQRNKLDATIDVKERTAKVLDELLEKPAPAHLQSGEIRRAYTAPFDIARIRKWALNWFVLGTTSPERALRDAEEFLNGIARDEEIRKLVRTPNLLVIAAQVFGVTNQLPDGRTRLYDAIAQAYLESVDQLYRVDSPLRSYSLESKMRWLAQIAWEIQLRRVETGSEDTNALLVSQAEVLQSLNHAISIDSDFTSIDLPERAEEVLDAIARRSGLLIPRSENAYAFAHLSFQEYFSAYWLHDAMLAYPPAVIGKQNIWDYLGELPEQRVWHETISFLVEFTSWPRGQAERMLQHLFPELGQNSEGHSQSEADQIEAETVRCELLARLLFNPYIKLSPVGRERAFERCWSLIRDKERRLTHIFNVDISQILPRLMQSAAGKSSVYRAIVDDQADTLNLEAVRNVSLDMLPNVPLVHLNLRSTGVVDLTSLSRFSALEWLILSDTAVYDLRPLEQLTKLHTLELERTAVMDLKPLESLISLSELDLDQTKIADLSPLKRLSALTRLELDGCSLVVELAPLAGTPLIEWLDLDSTGVKDITALSALKQLQNLWLNFTSVRDLRPLKSLPNLATLSLTRTKVKDLSPLRDLPKLRKLWLGGTPVSDLRPLEGMTSLEVLRLDGTKVTDLSPLANLTKLKELSLDGITVKNLQSLGRLIAGGLKVQGLPEAVIASLGKKKKNK